MACQELHIIDTVSARLSRWWRQAMETFTALVALCEANPPFISGCMAIETDRNVKRFGYFKLFVLENCLIDRQISYLSYVFIKITVIIMPWNIYAACLIALIWAFCISTIFKNKFSTAFIEHLFAVCAQYSCVSKRPTVHQCKHHQWNFLESVARLTHWGRDKRPPFSRRHFQMDFLEWKCMNFD